MSARSGRVLTLIAFVTTLASANACVIDVRPRPGLGVSEVASTGSVPALVRPPWRSLIWEVRSVEPLTRVVSAAWWKTLSP